MQFMLILIFNCSVYLLYIKPFWWFGESLLYAQTWVLKPNLGSFLITYLEWRMVSMVHLNALVLLLLCSATSQTQTIRQDICYTNSNHGRNSRLKLAFLFLMGSMPFFPTNSPMSARFCFGVFWSSQALRIWSLQTRTTTTLTNIFVCTNISNANDNTQRFI